MCPTPSPEDWNTPSFRNVVFFYLEFRTIGKVLKATNSVEHNRQNPLDYSCVLYIKVHSEYIKTNKPNNNKRITPRFFKTWA
jgi:hypothetical protein